MNIVDFIPKGKENAVTRGALCIYTGLDDRTVRKLIKIARDGGAPILSSSHSVGYWLSDDISRLKLSSMRQTAVAEACHAEHKGSDAM